MIQYSVYAKVLANKDKISISVTFFYSDISVHKAIQYHTEN